MASRHFIPLLLTIITIVSATTADAAENSPTIVTLPSRPAFDATRLRPGRFVYRNLRDGKEVARFVLTVQPLPDGNTRFTGEAAGFNQRWESVAGPSFVPVSALLMMETKTRDHFSMTLRYGETDVTGESVTTPLSSYSTATAIAPVKKAIHDRITATTVDQRIDWAAVLSSALVPGQSLSFTVYDPTTGISQVTAAVTPGGTLNLPSGPVETVRGIYLIQKARGTEAYEVWTTPDPPRVLLREVFPNGTSTELIEAGPIPDSKN